MKRIYTRQDRYDIVADALRSGRGSILDIGARDRILKSRLNGGYDYFSADVVDGHDYTINLEDKLQFEDNKFDFVVALDVLEHIENIHGAFHELARTAGKMLIVSLPNMACLKQRTAYLTGGVLATGKYDLDPEPACDRHRWLTVYPEMNNFIEENAASAGLRIERIVDEMEHGRFMSRFALACSHLGIARDGLMTCRCVYFLSKT